VIGYRCGHWLSPQVRDSPYRFTRAHWSRPLVWLAEGWVVLERFAMPILGEGDAEPNDTFVQQVVMNAEAAVEEVIRRGVAVAGKIAVGGHSYGAFMTAHLLAHSTLFAAGLARSGAYNRTLTPMGFQVPQYYYGAPPSERARRGYPDLSVRRTAMMLMHAYEYVLQAEERDYWHAMETYHTLSPFTYALQIAQKGAPLLLIHGDNDNNSGTHPMQSERMYQAVSGQGGVVKLVLLPHEAHGYKARESIMHTLAEQHSWLTHWVVEGEAPLPTAQNDQADRAPGDPQQTAAAPEVPPQADPCVPQLEAEIRELKRLVRQRGGCCSSKPL
jgi:dipeptidyl aminopeptidase/acylaminoacyl peptidase